MKNGCGTLLFFCSYYYYDIIRYIIYRENWSIRFILCRYDIYYFLVKKDKKWRFNAYLLCEKKGINNFV